jgi:hypothetical protein
MLEYVSVGVDDADLASTRVHQRSLPDKPYPLARSSGKVASRNLGKASVLRPRA